MMKSSVRAFRVFGISIEVHVSFILLVAVVLLSLPVYGVGWVFFLATMFAFVLFHELAHALVAKRAGVGIDNITLMFFGGVASVEVPENPRLELLMASAGPALNIAVALACLLIIHYAGIAPIGIFDAMSPSNFTLTASQLLHTVLYANTLLALFNIIPGFPMDGGRILRSILAMRMDYIRATELSVSVGQRLIFPLLFFVGLLDGNAITMVIAAALFIASGSELKFVRLKRVLAGLTVGDVARKSVPKVAGSVSLHDFIAAITDGSATQYLVHGGDGRVLGVFDVRTLGGISSRDLGKPVLAYANPEYLTADAGKMMSDALKEALSNDFLLVVSDRRVVGYLTPQLVLEQYNLLSLKKALR